MKQQGEIILSKREYEIACLVAQKHGDKEIANFLNISHSTVRFHIKNVRSKIQVLGRVGIAVWVIKQEFHNKQSPTYQK